MTDESKDIRWHQRFINFNKAYNQLEKFVAHGQLNEMEGQGLIKAFELFKRLRLRLEDERKGK